MHHIRLLVLVGTICLSCWGELAAQDWSECPTPTSCYPDNDATGFNNTRAEAIELGEARDPQTGQPRILSAIGQLGRVQIGFDSVDYFKFTLPRDFFEVEISTRETPPTSSWIMVYDELGAPLLKEEEGRGRDHERITLNLRPGVYYVSVATNAEVAEAKGGNLKYALAVRPIQRPLPNDGIANCDQRASWIFVDAGQPFNGTLDTTRIRHTYPVAITRLSELSTFLTRPRGYETGIVDRVTNERFSMSDRISGNTPYRFMDPGFYCLEVDAIPGIVLPVNYSFRLHAAAGGMEMGRALSANAPCLPSFNRGILRNGHYDGSPYRNGVPCPLEKGVEYIAREWIGTAGDGWIRVLMPGPGRVEITLSNLYSPVRAEIRDADGVIVGTTSVSGISISDQLPHQVWSGALQQGMHYLRVMHVGRTRPGTSFQLRLIAN